MILIAIAIILLSLLLAGCSSSSPLIPDIFLLSLYYKSYEATPDTAQVYYNVHSALANIAGGARLQARVGYFGICVNPDGGSWLCSNNATALAKEVSQDQDPLNLIWLAAQFKDMIVFPYLMYVDFSFALLPETKTLTAFTESSPSSLPFSASSSSPHFPRGTRRKTQRAPTASSAPSPRAPSLRSRSASSSSPPSLCSSRCCGSTRRPSPPRSLPRTLRTASSSRASAPRPWCSAGSRLPCSSLSRLVSLSRY